MALSEVCALASDPDAQSHTTPGPQGKNHSLRQTVSPFDRAPLRVAHEGKLQAAAWTTTGCGQGLNKRPLSAYSESASSVYFNSNQSSDSLCRRLPHCLHQVVHKPQFDHGPGRQGKGVGIALAPGCGSGY